MSRNKPRSEAWARFYANHNPSSGPRVVAVWGESNGYAPNCGCDKCDPEKLQPRPDILASDHGVLANVDEPSG